MKIYKTAIFQIPFEVFQGIANHIRTVYREIVHEDVNKVTEARFPPTTFNLDFIGTNFAFLNELNPTVDVKFTQNTSESSYFEKTGPTTGSININLMEDIVWVLSQTLEHEVLHFVQELIQTHRQQKHGTKKNVDLGGLPPESVIDKTISTEGYRKKYMFVVPFNTSYDGDNVEFSMPLPSRKTDQDNQYVTYNGKRVEVIAESEDNALNIFKEKFSNKTLLTNRGDEFDINDAVAKKLKSNKRVEHTLRPVEHYTDLNTLIRSAQYFRHYLNKTENGRSITNLELFKAIVSKQVKEVMSDKLVALLPKMYNQIHFMYGTLDDSKKNPKLFNLYQVKLWKGLNQSGSESFGFAEEFGEEITKLKDDKKNSPEVSEANEPVVGGLDERQNPIEITPKDFDSLRGTFSEDMIDLHYWMINDEEEYDGDDYESEHDSALDLRDKLVEKLPYLREDDEGYVRFPKKFKQVLGLLLKAKKIREKTPQVSSYLDKFIMRYLDSLSELMVDQFGKSFAIEDFYKKFYHSDQSEATLANNIKKDLQSYS